MGAVILDHKQETKQAAPEGLETVGELMRFVATQYFNSDNPNLDAQALKSAMQLHIDPDEKLPADNDFEINFNWNDETHFVEYHRRDIL
jgi:hypothetical protein